MVNRLAMESRRPPLAGAWLNLLLILLGVLLAALLWPPGMAHLT